MLDLQGDLEILIRAAFVFHIRELLMSFGKWNDTEGFSVVTQISISQCAEEDGYQETDLFERTLFWLLAEFVTDSLRNTQNLKHGEGNSY